MAGTFTAVDLSQLPAPDVVEPLDFEAIFAEMLADLQARFPEFSALVQSDPAFKILQVAAYRELLVRQRVNDAAHAVMLPYARGADLDNLAALFNVVRLVVDPGDPDAIPPVPPTLESDADFRRRVTLSLEGFSTAGPVGAYIFHALSADGDVKDVSVVSPAPGDVLVTILSRTGNGQPSGALTGVVGSKLNADEIRPLTDSVTVQAATIVNYTIEATLVFFDGPDRSLVMQSAQAAAQRYADAQHRLGRDITLSGVFAALHQPGVQRVDLTSPATSIVIDANEAAFCTAIALADGGVADA